MDKFPSPESPDELLARKFGLNAGKFASFEKVAIHGTSAVPVGSIAEGTLAANVAKGSGVELSSGASLSKITALEEKGGVLFVRTETSTYRLRQETTSTAEAALRFDDIAEVQTAKGSSYRYLPDGTTQRYKKVEGRDYDAQAALVYVPSFEWLQANADPRLLPLIGENDSVYTNIVLRYVHNLEGGKGAHIVDQTGKYIETNALIRAHNGPAYLALSTNDKADLLIPVSHTPRLGFMTFDTRRYVDPKTQEPMRERHLGNPVVKITLKNGREIS